MVVKLSSLVVKLGVARYSARWAYMRLKSGYITNRKQIFMVEYTKEIYYNTKDERHNTKG
jgi:hypothetical protein